VKVSADNRLPVATDKTLAFALYAIFRDFARQINALTDDVMPTANHSAAITADALVKTGLVTYRGFNVTVTTAVGTIDVRDGTSAGGGTIIDQIPMGTVAGTSYVASLGIICETGIYLDFNGGATGTVVVLYE
jgi:hypothetical protein